MTATTTQPLETSYGSTDTARGAVSIYRANAAQLRRLGKVRVTRNVGATQNAIDHRERVQSQTINWILGYAGAYGRSITGELTAESNLRDRLATGSDRPELQDRLRDSIKRANLHAIAADAIRRESE